MQTVMSHTVRISCSTYAKHTEPPTVAALADLATTPEAAFEEAMHNIFERKEEVHRFSMPNTSRKHPGKARWTLFEMWPINVSSGCQCKGVL